jgi:hypothetical protein
MLFWAIGKYESHSSCVETEEHHERCPDSCSTTDREHHYHTKALGRGSVAAPARTLLYCSLVLNSSVSSLHYFSGYKFVYYLKA